MHYTLPILPYSYDSLEPFIDTETMKIHHLKHHQTYINNLNDNIQNINFQNLSIEILLTKLDDIDIKYRNIIKNNAGGHINHTFFWKCLKHGTILSEELKKIIEMEFISINNFKSIFEEKAMKVFGSGWIWLLYQNKKLIIHSTINQDNPLMGLKFSGTYGYPIFGLDLWEHAYYLKYQNRRLNYIKSFWNIINWDVVLKNIKKYYIN